MLYFFQETMGLFPPSEGCETVKKTVIILGNILIVLAIIAFVITYAGSQ